VFPPPAEFAAKAHIKSLEQYEAMYRRSVERAGAVLGGGGGRTGVVRAVDEGAGRRDGLGEVVYRRQAEPEPQLRGPARQRGARRDKVALLWEGEPGEVRRITYGELHAQVQRFANVLKGLGVKKGDRVAIYMGMCPELAIAMLACARIGAVHSVIFGGFAAQAIVDRVNDSRAWRC
jgi:acetyl-CoA synthetase